MLEPLRATSFPQIVADMAAAGEQVTRLGAAEASAGNISVYARALDGLDPAFRPAQTLPLPIACPHLAGGWVVITGSGKRLRDIAADPCASLCLLQILPGGEQARLHQAAAVTPTSELDSHLAVHEGQAARAALSLHALVHAQPVSLTYLSHLEDYSPGLILSRRLVRWQPETILVFPEGIGLVPFHAPGTPAQAAATRPLMLQHRLVVWQKHGALARAGSAVGAADLIEYAEAAAAYEVLNLRLGEPASGLSDAELRQICAAYGVKQEII
jgi:rhamnulose-1-phosphate aldolase